MGLYFLNGIAAVVSFETPIPLFSFLLVEFFSGSLCPDYPGRSIKPPTPDVREMLSEVTATNQATHLYIISFPQFSIRTLDLILCNIFSPFPGYLFLLADTQPSESLSQVAAFDISRLLSKAPQISNSVLFNVRESLIKDWGPESIGALPEDTMQQLLTEVGYPLDTSEI